MSIICMIAITLLIICFVCHVIWNIIYYKKLKIMVEKETNKTVVGPKGDLGIKGDSGLPGIKGDVGSRGEIGPTGISANPYSLVDLREFKDLDPRFKDIYVNQILTKVQPNLMNDLNNKLTKAFNNLTDAEVVNNIMNNMTL